MYMYIIEFHSANAEISESTTVQLELELGSIIKSFALTTHSFQHYYNMYMYILTDIGKWCYYCTMVVTIWLLYRRCLFQIDTYLWGYVTLHEYAFQATEMDASAVLY